MSKKTVEIFTRCLEHLKESLEELQGGRLENANESRIKASALFSDSLTAEEQDQYSRDFPDLPFFLRTKPSKWEIGDTYERLEKIIL